MTIIKIHVRKGKTSVQTMI